MDGDLLGRWPELYSGNYNTLGNNNAYMEPSVAEFDTRCSSIVTDAERELMDFIHSMPSNFHAPRSDTSYVPNVPYLPSDNIPLSQRQPLGQQLYINTQLSFRQVDESESSTASSSSLLRTPGIHPHSDLRSFVYVPSPSAESGMLVPDSNKKSPLLVSPSSTYEGDMSDDPTSPLLVELDVVTQSPMSHILEWKRIIELCGTNDFVPQTVYQPHTEADKKRYIKEVELQDTIFFGLDNLSEWGIFLDDALKQRLLHLRNKDDQMFNGCGPSVSIRIQWPGYPAWSKQIPTMDFKTPKGPITRAKLAKNIATCIRRFFESVQDKPMEAEADTRWKIGERHIKVEDLILVSLHHVSKGSWQPQLRLRRPFHAFPYHFPPVITL